VQRARQRGGGLPRRPRVRQIGHRVVRNHVQHRVLAVQQPHDALDLVGPVVDAFEQRPLVLDRVAGGACIGFGALDQIGRVHARRAWQQLRAQIGPRGVQRQRQRRLDRPERQALEHARVAHGREHQVLVADGAGRAEEVDRLHHVVEVVRGLAHAHEHHLLDQPLAPRQHHLRHDLGAADLAQQALAPGHAEHAADRAADLGRHAQTVARQQHALDRLTIGQFDQQARRTVLAGVLRAQAGQAVQIGQQRRHGVAHGLREEIVGATAATFGRQHLRPNPQNPLFVTGFRTLGTQALAYEINAHRNNVWMGHAKSNRTGNTGTGPSCAFITPC